MCFLPGGKGNSFYSEGYISHMNAFTGCDGLYLLGQESDTIRRYGPVVVGMALLE